MKKSFRSVALALAAFAIAGCAQQSTSDWLQSQITPQETPVYLQIDPARPGDKISDTFSGVSFETRMMLAGNNGSHFFNANDKELVAVFRLLGIKSLRVGGNSLDNPAIGIPTNADIDALYAFAKAADLQIIYSVRLKGIETPAQIADDVRQVKYIWSKYADLTQAITIGNEPNIYFADTAPNGIGTAPATTTAPKTAILGGAGDSGGVGIGYAAYKKRWEQIATAIVREVPLARLCGPSSTPGKVAWAGAFATDESAGPLAPNFAIVTQHAYPGGNAQKVTDSAAGRELLLSHKMEENYEKFDTVFATPSRAAHRPFRLEESNSLFHGGATNISNTSASALWGLDFMWWWATRGADGVNFHTGMTHAAADHVPGGYDLFYDSAAGIQIHPMGYAAKTFDLAGRGRIVPLTLDNPSAANFTAYASLNGSELYITLINRENAGGNTGGHAVAAAITLPTSKWNAEILFLRPGKNDLSTLSGMTLGNSEIQPNGQWFGHSQSLATKTNRFLAHLQPGEAAVIHLHPTK